MGWYASTSWSLKFRSPEALDEFLREAAVALKRDEPFTAIGEVIGEFGEEGDASVAEDGVTVDGWTGGKAYDIGPEEQYVTVGATTYNRGGVGLYTVLAKYADGVVDWQAEGDYFWRIRFKGGTWASHDGEITYPTDKEG